MNRYAMFRSRWRSSSRLRICDWIETSSALTGSSQTMKSGVERERPGDADALPLAAGELVRVARRRTMGRGRRAGAAPATMSSLLAALGDAVDLDRLADDVADGHARVEAADRVLEDDLHVPAEPAQLLAAVGEEVLALVADLAAGGGDQAEDRAADGRLAAAGFADEAERLARRDVEADAVDGLHVADGAREHALA